MTETETFTLTDRRGKSHDYEIELHNPDEGFVLVQQLSALGLEPIAELLEGTLPHILTSIAESPKLLNAGREEDMQAMISGIDTEVLGNALRVSASAQRFSAVFQRLPVDIMQRLLSKTKRNGKSLIRDPGGVNPVFNEAYRGNYGEMFMAAWRSVVANAFFPDSVTSVVDLVGQIATTAAAQANRSSGPADTQTGGSGESPPPNNSPTPSPSSVENGATATA